MSLRDKLMIYIYNKKCKLETEKESILHQIKFGTNDSLDMYEIILAKIRIQAYEEFIDDIFKIVLSSK